MPVPEWVSGGCGTDKASRRLHVVGWLAIQLIEPARLLTWTGKDAGVHGACGLYKCWLLSFCLVILCPEREYLSGVWTLAIKLNRLVRAIRLVSALLQQFSSGDSVCRHSARGPRLINSTFRNPPCRQR